MPDLFGEKQREVLLSVLTAPSRPIMTTPDVASRTPWSVTTVNKLLHSLVDRGRVECVRRDGFNYWRIT